MITSDQPKGRQGLKTKVKVTVRSERRLVSVLSNLIINLLSLSLLHKAQPTYIGVLLGRARAHFLPSGLGGIHCLQKTAPLS